MQEYYFLFAAALIWTAAAVFMDIKKREVPNWISFSLIGIALAYRAFYSAYAKDISFFAFGLIAFALFFGLANLFYYSRVFAGGDAKLLMGIGIALPYQNYSDFILTGLGFIMLLFAVGAVYTLIYSVFLAVKHKKKFGEEFYKIYRKNKHFIVIFAIASLFVFMLVENIKSALAIYLLFALLFPMYIYLKALERCMIVYVNHNELSEGDWLEEDVKVNGRWIRKSVHGLSSDEIKILRKYKKSALIKQGIPFVPAFLIALVAMVFFFSSGLSVESLLAFLF